MSNASRPAIAAVLLMLCGAVQAAKISEVQIIGLDEAMTNNVRIALSLEDAIGKRVSDARLDYLLRVAADETREALEPFGYYSPQIDISETSAGAAIADDASVSVTIAVRAGEPVRVRSATVAIEGGGDDDPVTESVDQRFVRHCGRHGDQHPAAQSG